MRAPRLPAVSERRRHSPAVQEMNAVLGSDRPVAEKIERLEFLVCLFRRWPGDVAVLQAGLEALRGS